MTRSILSGLLGLISVVTIGVLPVACQSGGVGDPCTPEDEYSPDFAGFKVTEENIESRSFQCATRICLVNHFQGRVSCPLGQSALNADPNGRKSCADKNDTSCGDGAKCVEASTLALECTSDGECPTGTVCSGINAKAGVKGVCDCSEKAGGDKKKFPAGYVCDGTTLKSYACHKPNNCQVAGKAAKDNAGKDCCVPGTDTPVTAPVCGQCSGQKFRNAVQAVYCSCRCGVAAGQPAEPNFNFCSCPTGFECSEIRPDVGISDPQIAGKYCVRTGTAYTGQAVQECGVVDGHYESGICSGTPVTTK
jgi:hypothetical protein